ncbi:MAG: alpha/beta fold hydrolase, partial [Acetobacteraceae bacterium]|nr:alpha/beta fold hydrolase [Acetobacteraceae bacterium]
MSEQQQTPAAPTHGSPDALVAPWMQMFSAPFRNWSETWSGFGPVPATAGVDLEKAFVENPVLASIDKVWNANPLHDVIPIDWAGIAHALRVVAARSMANPGQVMARAVEFNADVLRSAAETWTDAARRWLGQTSATDAKPGGDKRFAAPEWQQNPAFRILRDLYLLASEALLQGAAATKGEDGLEERRIHFHLQQFVDAMSPSLMLFSNPVALRRVIETGGASIADGIRNLLDDLNQGRLSMVDATAFAPGRNLAMTPGKVVHRNKLIELIQYAPNTDQVYATPILLIPPWINKYYVLDLQPKNSMIGYLVSQGFTVFVISWKNPDASMESTTIEDYMHSGPLEASDVVREITGSAKLNVMGYCIGGTLLAMTLAWLAARGDERFGAATFIVSLQDFSRVGDTAVFSDEPAVNLIEQQMMERGYLDSREMSNMFNLLRSNDLIWSNVVNNYLLGQKPPAFDLLYWNSDGTRMARAAHSWYLRNTYRENHLVKPEAVVLDGVPLDLGRITLDIYAVGAEKDHIVPWDTAWRIVQLAGGNVRYVLASSGHIAGIINPP